MKVEVGDCLSGCHAIILNKVHTVRMEIFFHADRHLLSDFHGTGGPVRGNLINIGTLLNRKSIFFTPMVQDDPLKKPHSLVADFTLIEEALLQAMSGKQIPKMFI